MEESRATLGALSSATTSHRNYRCMIVGFPECRAQFSREVKHPIQGGELYGEIGVREFLLPTTLQQFSMVARTRSHRSASGGRVPRQEGMR